MLTKYSDEVFILLTGNRIQTINKGNPEKMYSFTKVGYVAKTYIFLGHPLLLFVLNKF